MSKTLKQLDIDELDGLYELIHNHPQKILADLFPGLPPGCSTAAQRIGQWALNRKAVLQIMAEDKPDIALIFRKVCHRIWQELPEYARCVKVRIE